MKTPGYILCCFSFVFPAGAQTGLLDATFGSNGITTTYIGATGFIARNDLAIQPDGKIVMAGWTKDSPFASFVIARYTENGVLDVTFDGNGIAYAEYDGISDYVANSIAIQEDGKILASGYSQLGPFGDFLICRLLPNGELDNNFNGNGKLKIALSAEDDRSYTLALQPDAKILMAGTAKSGAYSNFALARINATGKLDSTFDADGVAIQSLGNLNSRIYAIALQSDGKIIAVGSINSGANQDIALARFNSNGTLDLSFGDQGKIIDHIGNHEDVAYAVALQPDGKILVAGNSYINSQSSRFALLRYCPSGDRDESFGTNGIAVMPQFGSNSWAYAMALQPDNRILLAGTTGSNNLDKDFALAKYNPDGTLNSDFGIGGIATTDVQNSPAIAHSIALLPDYNIIVGGYTSMSSSAHLTLARYFNSPETTQFSTTICPPVTPVSSNEPSREQYNAIVYPNPVDNDVAMISYDLAHDDYMDIQMFDMSGRMIRSFINAEFRTQGNHSESVALDAIPAGYYILRIRNSNNAVNLQFIKL